VETNSKKTGGLEGARLARWKVYYERDGIKFEDFDGYDKATAKQRLANGFLF
jgi:hypothetical protein